MRNSKWEPSLITQNNVDLFEPKPTTITVKGFKWKHDHPPPNRFVVNSSQIVPPMLIQILWCYFYNQFFQKRNIHATEKIDYNFTSCKSGTGSTQKDGPSSQVLKMEQQVVDRRMTIFQFH